MSEDYHATPLSPALLNAVPPPMVQSNQKAPIDVPSYDDLRTQVELNSPARAAAALPPKMATPVAALLQPDASDPATDYATQASTVPPRYKPRQPERQPEYPPEQPQYAPEQSPHSQYQPQYQPQYQQPHPSQYAYHGPQYAEEYHEPAPEPPGWLARTLRANRSTLYVVAIVFAVLVFLVPRLARMQRFVTPEGRLSVLGKLLAAAAAGGAYRVALAVS